MASPGLGTSVAAPDAESAADKGTATDATVNDSAAAAAVAAANFSALRLAGANGPVDIGGSALVAFDDHSFEHVEVEVVVVVGDDMDAVLREAVTAALTGPGRGVSLGAAAIVSTILHVDYVIAGSH